MRIMSLKSAKTVVVLSIFMIASALIFVKCKTIDIGADAPISLKYDKESVPTLEMEFIDEVRRNYFNNQLNILNNPDSKKNYKLEAGDTHSVRFDLEALKKFIYHIEKNAQKNKIDSKDLGIRIHFIAYPNQENWEKHNDLKGFDLENQYRSRMSLMLIPTKKIKEKDVDFNILTNDTLVFKPFNFKMRSVSESLNQVNSKQLVPALNHGGAIPPIKSY